MLEESNSRNNLLEKKQKKWVALSYIINYIVM
jgi:hypothetical protein